MLILFDIDLTLIDARSAGRDAMETAGRACFGPAFTADGVDYAGRLDPVITADLLALNSVDPDTPQARRFEQAFADAMRASLDRAKPVTLPGVHDLLAALETTANQRTTPPLTGGSPAEGSPTAMRLTLGLLTGNIEHTGRLKLIAAGLDPDRFPVRVWGDDSPHVPPLREHLPPVAVERCRDHTGHAPGPDQVLIIGDTPHDVAAARANGCRSLAVATGSYDRATLSDAGADLVVDTLGDTDRLLHWILNPPNTPR